MSTPIDAVVLRFIGFLETGEAHPELFTDDVFTDFTMPTWRLQASGREDSIALRLRGHPAASRRVANNDSLPG